MILRAVFPHLLHQMQSVQRRKLGEAAAALHPLSYSDLSNPTELSQNKYAEYIFPPACRVHSQNEVIFQSIPAGLDFEAALEIATELVYCAQINICVACTAAKPQETSIAHRQYIRSSA